MVKENAIQFTTLHLDGIAYDRWQHGMTTQGHIVITSFDIFRRRMINHFDQKDEDDYSKDLLVVKKRDQ